MKNIFILIIKFYQRVLSPFFGIAGKCRFTPSCSDYALEAFEKLSFFKAFYKISFRILRCHPFHAGGYDPLIIKDNE